SIWRWRSIFPCNLLFDDPRGSGIRTHAGFRGHQSMVFAEAGIKLLIGQSQGDLRPRPRSDSVKRLSNISPPPSDQRVERFSGLLVLLRGELFQLELCLAAD